MISVAYNQRVLPIYWHILSHKRASNLTKQKVVIRLVIKLLKGQKIMITGDREFHSIVILNKNEIFFSAEILS